jgi:RND family efflux transporter MFP subunit
LTTRERQLLAGGVLAGLLLAAILIGIIGWRNGSGEKRGVEMAESQIAPVPAKPMADGAQHLAHGSQFSPVQLSEQEQRSIGLETAEVRRRVLAREVRATARVEEAETQLSTISARVGGRIDDLLLEFTGQAVRRGQPVARIYSPELVASAEEYKLALQAQRGLGDGAQPQAVVQARDLAQASRRRLELWGITEKQIEEIASSSEPNIQITIHSSATGIVTERKVTEGQYVKEGDVLYTLADLSKVWVMADVYESDLPLVHVGQRVEITSPSSPGTKLRGTVSFIEPMVEPQTRTVAVRIQVANPGLRLRPAMYVDVRLLTRAEPQLVVPRSAVLDSGTRKLVYVAAGDGVFQARAVDLGPPGEEFYPVISGVKAGERVVTHGSFMLDSQTRITGGMSGLFGGSKEFKREEAVPKPEQPVKYNISFRTEPDPPKGATENAFHVQLLGPDGKPLDDAEVKLMLVMPAMPSMGMPEMRSAYDLKWTGKEYVGRGNIPMAGPWSVLVEARRNGQLLKTFRTQFSAR